MYNSIHKKFFFSKIDSRHYEREKRFKYSKLSSFDENRIEWKQWRVHLKTKIWICYKNFFTKQHKINYVRDHCKDIVYKIIKYKVFSINRNLYFIFQKFILNLKNAFEKVDEHSKAINELFNLIFFMKLSKKNEIFDEFLTRFNFHIIEFIFDDALKIIQLKRIMIEKLNYDIKYLIKCINFKIFCDEVRKIAKLNK